MLESQLRNVVAKQLHRLASDKDWSIDPSYALFCLALAFNERQVKVRNHKEQDRNSKIMFSIEKGTHLKFEIDKGKNTRSFNVYKDIESSAFYEELLMGFRSREEKINQWSTPRSLYRSVIMICNDFTEKFYKSKEIEAMNYLDKDVTRSLGAFLFEHFQEYEQRLLLDSQGRKSLMKEPFYKKLLGDLEMEWLIESNNDRIKEKDGLLKFLGKYSISIAAFKGYKIMQVSNYDLNCLIEEELSKERNKVKLPAS